MNAPASGFPPGPAAVTARIARWRRTLDPQDLWPETDPAARVAGYQDILSATETILSGGTATLRTRGQDARALGVAAFASGMGPLLGWWVAQGQLTGPPEVAALLERHLGAGRRRAGVLHAQVRRVAAALRAFEVDPVLLKGGYTARRYFPEPGVRPAADLDFLLLAEQVDRARDAMLGLGLERRGVHNQPYREEWAPPDAPAGQSLEVVQAEDPWAVDLHHSLDRSYLPGVVAGLGSPGPVAFETWAGDLGPVQVLRQPWLTAHLALHAGASLPDVHLIRLVELALVIRQDLAAERLRWADLQALLTATGTQRFAFPALELTAALAPGVVDESLRAHLSADATPRLRRAVDRCRGMPPYHALHRPIEERFAWSKGLAEVGSNVLHVLYPTGHAMSPAERLRIVRRRISLVLRGRVSWRPVGRP